MTDSDTQQGPRVVWTFPLITRMQTRSRVLDLGGNLASLIQGDGVGGNIRDRLDNEDQDGSAKRGEPDKSNQTSSIENEIGDLRESGSDLFDDGVSYSSSDDVAEIDIEDGVFIPTRANVESGTTVRWTNNDDQMHRVSSIEGEDFMSEQLEPGESFEHTFDSEGVNIYIDSTRGADQMSGAIIVGDVEAPATLPSESGEDPVILDSGTSSTTSTSTRSMSEAAEEKDNMDIGFSD